jgi:uncharacterized Fe-S cluster protein YjdI
MAETKQKRKEYSNGEVTVVWEAYKCFHSEKCIKGLPGVFDLSKKPWIDVHGATSEAIVNQVHQCPSGALSIKEETMRNNDVVKIDILDNGPLLVNGNIEVKNKDGEIISYSGVNALCRCGGSKKKPFCDGSHNDIDFDG